MLLRHALKLKPGEVQAVPPTATLAVGLGWDLINGLPLEQGRRVFASDRPTFTRHTRVTRPSAQSVLSSTDVMPIAAALALAAVLGAPVDTGGAKPATAARCIVTIRLFTKKRGTFEHEAAATHGLLRPP